MTLGIQQVFYVPISTDAGITSQERSLRSIAAMTRHSRQKVTEVIRLAEKRGLKCPLDEDMTDAWIEDFLYPEKKLEASVRQVIDVDYLHEELAKPHVTLILLHEEYHHFAEKYKATMRIRRKPGELLEVDWASSTLFIIDPDTGEKVKNENLCICGRLIVSSTFLCGGFFVHGLSFINTRLNTWGAPPKLLFPII
ncbi:hypothetical protein HNR44_000696 [Geomicrobium halophilum]|uniref:Uncharacterized protein n=1 Tax=Geomicrobium halophilum TaxID=549000 RepID=A0A841PIP0_9BACL|nr:hypothetical protein [Geomicrobium halophilum]MBB6448747.1 hypothetical protein [Geomicrobium halophilum]